ncbi:MAG: TerB family tellurite resistance protein [Cellvibrionaceae bacterium]|nr:TerB family tellurite resistance protein [Cellvibrionaceae bacterium]
MLNKIKEFFQAEMQTRESEDGPQRHNLACAALLVEVALTDQKLDESEVSALLQALQQQFKLDQKACQRLYELAQEEAQQATSTHQFTQLVNQYSSPEEKFQLIKSMWSIAYADNNLDKYEEAVIRKVAELIYVSHSDFIRAKHSVRPNS